MVYKNNNLKTSYNNAQFNCTFPKNKTDQRYFPQQISAYQEHFYLLRFTNFFHNFCHGFSLTFLTY